MSGERLLSGRYQVQQLLGRGGMAEVHAGVDTRLGRRVAIKLLRTDLARDPSFHERLKREAQAAAALNHPGIVGVYDSGEEPFTESGGATVQVPFIVMEYVEGRTLREVLSEHGHLTVQEALDVAAGVLSPLDYSHRNGIVHRDIKPANVMLTPEGDIKVMDFGIARALEDTGSLTGTQSVVGTAQYLSPEQARGEVVDARSDLYSTGCLLYELLTDRPPFTGDSQLAVAYQHVGETPQPPSFYNPEVPPAVDALVLHSLGKDRDKRYQDAFTFREDTLAARDGRPMSISGPAAAAAAGSPPTAATQYMPTAQGSTPTQAMNYSQVTTPAAADAAPAAGDAGAAANPETTGMSTLPNRQEDTTKEAKKRGWWWGLAAILVIVLAGLGLWVYNMTKGPDPFALEDLSGKTQSEAKEYLSSNGLESSTKKVHDDDVKSGNIVKTDPISGTKVVEGDTVTIYVSSGPASVKVPDVGGNTEPLARQKLEDAGLKAGDNVEKNSPDVEKGNIINTSPKHGKSVKRGSTVKLNISNGMVEVPKVTGKKQDAACKLLRSDDYGLECNVETEETADHDAGKVFEQSTNGGDTVEQHATITIKVAKAPPSPTPTPEPSESTGAGNNPRVSQPILPPWGDDSKKDDKDD